MHETRFEDCAIGFGASADNWNMPGKRDIRNGRSTSRIGSAQGTLLAGNSIGKPAQGQRATLLDKL